MKKFEEMKEKAFCFNKPIRVILGSNLNPDIITPQIEGKERRYNLASTNLTFVCGNKQYVIPYTEAREDILIQMGYTRDCGMYVPFCFGGYPIEEKEKWEALIKEK